MAKSSANKLTDAHKTFLVKQLACYSSPKETAEALKAEFGVEISPQGVENYDPTKKQGASKWKGLFDETRKHFLAHVEEHIPEANKAVRVGHLVHAARALKARGNYGGMADMLERIAKELGGAFTNRRELTGADGKPIEFKEMSDEQLDAKLGMVLAALGGGEQKPDVRKPRTKH